MPKTAGTIYGLVVILFSAAVNLHFFWGSTETAKSKPDPYQLLRLEERDFEQLEFLSSLHENGLEVKWLSSVQKLLTLKPNVLIRRQAMRLLSLEPLFSAVNVMALTRCTADDDEYIRQLCRQSLLRKLIFQSDKRARENISRQFAGSLDAQKPGTVDYLLISFYDKGQNRLRHDFKDMAAAEQKLMHPWLLYKAVRYDRQSPGRFYTLFYGRQTKQQLNERLLEDKPIIDEGRAKGICSSCSLQPAVGLDTGKEAFITAHRFVMLSVKPPETKKTPENQPKKDKGNTTDKKEKKKN